MPRPHLSLHDRPQIGAVVRIAGHPGTIVTCRWSGAARGYRLGVRLERGVLLPEIDESVLDEPAAARVPTAH